METIDEAMARKVAEALRDYFDKNAITQTMIAEKLGCSQAIVSARLTGSRPFGKNAAWKWSRAFGFSPSFLTSGVGYLIAGEDSGIVEEGTGTPAPAPAPVSGGDRRSASYFANLCRELMEQIVERDRRICCLEEELKKERENNGTL